MYKNFRGGRKRPVQVGEVRDRFTEEAMRGTWKSSPSSKGAHPLVQPFQGLASQLSCLHLHFDLS